MGTVVPLTVVRRRLSRTAEPAVYSVPEVAVLLRLHLGGVYELLRDGTIPAEQLGRRWIISRVRFHAWLDGLGEED